jgi:hypothetical protein
MSKLQKKSSALKRGHPTHNNELLQTFFYFCGSFLLSWIRIRIPNTDPESGSGFTGPIEYGSNPDPDPKPCSQPFFSESHYSIKNVRLKYAIRGKIFIHPIFISSTVKTSLAYCLLNYVSVLLLLSCFKTSMQVTVNIIMCKERPTWLPAVRVLDNVH